MSVFVAQMTNQPGELANLLEVLGDAGVNVMLTAVTQGQHGIVLCVVDDQETARGALTEASVRYRERPSVVFRVDNKPGTGAQFCRELADAGVNIDYLLPLEVNRDHATLVLVAGDGDKAREVLGDRVLTG